MCFDCLSSARKSLSSWYRAVTGLNEVMFSVKLVFSFESQVTVFKKDLVLVSLGCYGEH